MEYNLRVRINKRLYRQAMKKAEQVDISLNDYLIAELQKMVREKKLTLVA